MTDPVDESMPQSEPEDSTGAASSPQAGGETAEESEAELDSEAGADRPTYEDLVAERDQFREIALRTRADFDNYQKRVARDWEMERKYAPQRIITDLLPALDNLERALDSAAGATDVAALTEGVRIVRKQLVEAFQRHGIEQIVSNGESFDPNLHEAITQQPTSDWPPLTVLQTFRAGYRFHDRVLRPAQVIVSCEPPAAGAAAPIDERASDD